MITKRIVFDHRGRTMRGHEGPIEICVTHQRKRIYLNTGIHVRGSQLVNGRIVDRSDMVELNQRLDLIAKRVDIVVNQCFEECVKLDASTLKARVFNIEMNAPARTNMYEWIVEQVPLLSIKDSTRKRYHVLLRRLQEYGKMMSWDDLTIENLYKFDHWLHRITKIQSNGDIQACADPEYIHDAGVYNYHKTLRAILTRAVKFGVIDRNPYDRLRGEIKKGENENVEYLTESEIEAIESLHPIEGTQVAMARDMFIFQMYTGLSYSDAQAFDIANYKKHNGRWVHVGNRIKTGVAYVSDLLPQAVEVLNRYGMQVPKIGNAQYNESLKVIQQACGISTRMHSHLARHTFATRMLSLGAKLENVSKALGHTNTRQTERYAKVLAESVHNDFAMIEEKLTKKKR